MQSILNHIIELERQAKQLTEEAKAESEKSFELEIEEIKTKHMQIFKNQLNEIALRENSAVEEKLPDINKKFQDILNALNQKYISNKDQWVDELVARCIEPC